ncbi:uncharacterized protein LOC117898711 [Drosophila subobscura]|uniref:uncharacterized protein LOC117898711 n=1 Tax=Drosophila subobscura TaxID=7241 RepID=UPI00155B3218|nr:uncharacterized protein LOC117898711 [Drosophila subobscura]
MLLRQPANLYKSIFGTRRSLSTTLPAGQSFRKWYQQLWTATLHKSEILCCGNRRLHCATDWRFESVKLSGLDTISTQKDLELSGWNARIAQHEMDHLDGKLYTDQMDRSTFSCTCWEAVNTKSGRVEIPFYK